MIGPKGPHAATGAAPARGLSAGEIAQRLGGELRGPKETAIHGVNALADAGPRDITFISDSRYASQWAGCRAAAAVVSRAVQGHLQADGTRPLIIVPDAEIAMINLAGFFAPPPPLPEIGVHPSAVIHPSASLGAKVRIGPHVSVDRDCTIGDGATLCAGVRVGQAVQIGADSVLHCNVVVAYNCVLGSNVTLQQGVSIGADGFGYRPVVAGGVSELQKMPHVGNVIIEDDVEIGANTCVDRAKFGSTVIGKGTKIDNLCQIAHNCRIGQQCVIAALVGLAGSVTVGDFVQIGGMAGIADHLEIGAGARIGANSGVISDIPPGETWMGYPADKAQAVLRQWAAIRKLPDQARRARQSASPGQREVQ